MDRAITCKFQEAFKMQFNHLNNINCTFSLLGTHYQCPRAMYSCYKLKSNDFFEKLKRLKIS